MSQERQVPGDILGLCRSLAESVRRSDWNAGAIQDQLRSIRTHELVEPRRFTLSRLQFERVLRHWQGILGEGQGHAFACIYAPIYHPEFPFPLRPAHPQLTDIVRRAIFWTPVTDVRVRVTEGEWYKDVSSGLGNSLEAVFGRPDFKELSEHFHFSNLSTDELGPIYKQLRRQMFELSEDQDVEGEKHEASYEVHAPLDDALLYASGLALPKGLDLAFQPLLDMWDLGNWPLSVEGGVVEVLCAPGEWGKEIRDGQ